MLQNFFKSPFGFFLYLAIINGLFLNPFFNILVKKGCSLWFVIPFFAASHILATVLFMIFLFKSSLSKHFKLLVAFYSMMGALIWSLFYWVYKMSGSSYLANPKAILFLPEKDILSILAMKTLYVIFLFGTVYVLMTVGNAISIWVLEANKEKIDAAISQWFKLLGIASFVLLITLGLERHFFNPLIDYYYPTIPFDYDKKLDDDGTTPLIAAINQSKYELVNDLLELNVVDINLQTNYGMSALMLAVIENKLDMTRLLLKYKANPDLISSNGHTALLIAVVKGNSEIVQELLAHAANPNIQDCNKKTSLFYAEKMGHTEIVKLLIKHGAHL